MVGALLMMCLQPGVAQKAPTKKVVQLKDAKGADVGTATILSKGSAWK